MKWKDDFIYQAYELAREGKSDKDIAQHIELTRKEFIKFRKSKPAFKNAIERGRSSIRALAKGFQLTQNQRNFLSAFSETGNKSKACEASFVTYECHGRWLRQSEERGDDYASAFEIAKEIAADKLEWEARRRGTEGMRQYKFFRGMPILIPCEPDDPEGKVIQTEDGPVHVKHYYEVTYSDTLLLTLLKASRPEKYAERKKVEQTGSGGGEAILLDLLDRTEDERKAGLQPDIIDAEFVANAADQFIEQKGVEIKPKKKAAKKKTVKRKRPKTSTT